MKYQIQIEKSALKKLSKIETQTREKIRTAIRQLADEPRPHGYKKLVDGGGVYRIKVNGYRIFYDVFDTVLIINVISIDKRNERTY